jgi:predicted site-specific integrase-resolvase
MNAVFVKPKDATKLYGVSPITLRRWADDNKIKFKRTINGHRVYDVTEFATHKATEHTKPQDTSRENYIYIRVSSAKQKDDLERQKEYMESKYPGCNVIKDIASGLNFKRKGLIRLLELCKDGKVDKVMVSSKDRLCRFGFDLLEWMFRQYDVELVVLDKTDKSPEQEFTEDILSILQVFACRWNGKRKYIVENKKGQIEVDVSPKENAEEVEQRL